MNIIAKPVVDNQFWILKQDNRKIGNIEATDDGYAVKIDNKITSFKTINMIRQRANIEFEAIGNKPNREPASYQVQGYPSGSRVYNPVWDVPHALPLYTKGAKSRSWFAAGWYSVKKGRKWRTVQDPKLIVLQRYPYHGPFYNQQEITND